MRSRSNIAAVLFLAASSVYSNPAVLADPATSEGLADHAKSTTDVKMLEDAAAPAETQPATRPADPGQSVSAQQVNVSDAGTVEIHVNDASLVEVLRMLSLQSQKNIVASKDVHGSITANLYDVTVREALDAILHANGYDYREKGNFIFVYTTKEIQDMEKAARVMKTEVFRLYYTPAADALVLIKPVLSPEGQVSITPPAVHGIDSGSTDVGGNSHATEDLIVVSDFADNLQRVHAILKEVDRRPQQILVEATILRATLSDNNSLGIDFTALGGVNFSTLGEISPGGTGSGLQQALSGSLAQNGGAAPAAGQARSAGSLAGHVTDKGYVAGSLGGNGLQLGLVKDSVGVFITALEGVTDTVVLGNPKVLVLNKQKGEVHVGSKLGYKTSITTDTLTSSDVKFLETGTRLVFRPYVGEDGNIRMEIHPEDSSGSVNDQGLPNEDVTEVTSNVMVKDGHTIVIGGLFRESTTRTRSQVPLLGSLPGIGALFRNQTDSTVREEVIVLLTPHIVKDERAYTDASEQELKDAERMRVGMRRGLMPWGRERLAESWYENAVAEMNKPNPNRGKAIWDLNCATNLNPVFSEAIEMKSQVTGKEVTAADNSTIRAFVRRQIMAERAHPATMPVAPVDDSAFMLPDAVESRGPAFGPASQPADPAGFSARAGAAPRRPATQPLAELPASRPAEAAAPQSPLPASEPVAADSGGARTSGDASITELPEKN